MKRHRSDIESDLKRAIDRFESVKKHGNKVISTYDLMMGYDADFYLNRVPILESHVLYFTKELERFDNENPGNGHQFKLQL